MKLTLKAKKLKSLSTNIELSAKQTPQIGGAKHSGPSRCTMNQQLNMDNSGPTKCTAV